MAITQNDIDKINQAIAKGEHIVRFADRMVEYRSVDELIKAKNVMVAELAKAQNPRRARTVRIYRAGKGY